MKRLIPLSIIILFISTTGCIQNQQVGGIDFNYPNFSKGDRLDYVDFVLPDGINRGGFVELVLTFPSGAEKGTYRREITNRVVSIYVNERLSETGIYRLNYKGEDFTKNEYFFVGKTPDKVAFDIKQKSFYGGELKMKIENIGRETGELNLVVLDNKVSKSAGINVYNRELKTDTVDIRNGFYEEYSIYTGTDDVLILLNEEVMRLEL